MLKSLLAGPWLEATRASRLQPPTSSLGAAVAGRVSHCVHKAACLSIRGAIAGESARPSSSVMSASEASVFRMCCCLVTFTCTPSPLHGLVGSCDGVQVCAKGPIEVCCGARANDHFPRLLMGIQGSAIPNLLTAFKPPSCCGVRG
ncbi:hypothetical protein BU16DRAFT_169452 [Lophium mytilinum]|uniref:Uncharacterized protein n=1 Tax=Lophium mytilinum TaxID=390894 RepID=A0A6A6QCS6_9PEZI|nr:hypothetical protein BU16DRAFT_169452 [Lophium mytilinum]